MATIKHSKQREAIKNFLISRNDHPTAETVYAHVIQDFPNISLGTVYRNLAFLVENGQAIKVPCNDGSVHFDAKLEPHYHFQCVECNAVIDLDFDDHEVVNAMNTIASSQFPGIIEGNVTFFYGRCKNCANKSKNENQL